MSAMKELILIALMLVASIHCVAIKSEQSHGEHGKGKSGSHLGFFGSRGKRSVNTNLASSLQPMEANGHEDDNLREWPALRESLYNFERSIRAPKGFFALRGKKDFLNEEKRALLGVQQNFNGLRDRPRFTEAQMDEDEFQPFNPKRAPMQAFYGVRGKKFGDYDLSGSFNEKRAPKGFLGMRGKKSGDNIDDELVDEQQIQPFDYNSLYESKRVPSGFMGVRGKKDS